MNCLHKGGSIAKAHGLDCRTGQGPETEVRALSKKHGCI